jgi:hypothetical protein
MNERDRANMERIADELRSIRQSLAGFVRGLAGG